MLGTASLRFDRCLLPAGRRRGDRVVLQVNRRFRLLHAHTCKASSQDDHLFRAAAALLEIVCNFRTFPMAFWEVLRIPIRSNMYPNNLVQQVNLKLAWEARLGFLQDVLREEKQHSSTPVCLSRHAASWRRMPGVCASSETNRIALIPAWLEAFARELTRLHGSVCVQLFSRMRRANTVNASTAAG